MLEQHSIRVLVVDDYRDAAESLAIAIRRMGHEVKCAYDPIAAMGIAESFQPHAMFLDILMPRMDGYELAQRLRRVVNAATLIAVTGLGEDGDRHRGWDAGFHYFMVKPVDHEDLESLLEVIGSNLKYPSPQKCEAVVEVEELRKSRCS